ncbi:MAG: hypothetical protein OXE54_00265 [Gammaproteobacteria bacterium]|nr:hypothetical protein [Gammaproteobacteria bacterium]MCY4295396.1 hypothetical protein [Gammaproteobacteria bacterium]
MMETLTIILGILFASLIIVFMAIMGAAENGLSGFFGGLAGGMFFVAVILYAILFFRGITGGLMAGSDYLRARRRSNEPRATEKQINLLRKLDKQGKTDIPPLETLTEREASALIRELKTLNWRRKNDSDY